MTMFKRIISSLVILAVFASLSLAKAKDFGPLTIDVPSGWKILRANDSTIVISTLDETKALRVDAGRLDGRTLEEVAQAAAKEMNGTKPRYDKKTGTYRFRGMLESMYEMNIIVRGFENSDVVVRIFWAADGASISKKQVESILNSLRVR